MIKILSERAALKRLNTIISNFRFEISKFEHRAKSCATCEVQGSCCLDEHFVNVHISRLEAAAIRRAIDEMPAQQRTAVNERIDRSIEKYDLRPAGDTFGQMYACPLFEKRVGCLVHNSAKPIPCIAHACYDNAADLPPDELQIVHEILIDKLNRRTYGRAQPLLPIPLAVRS